MASKKTQDSFQLKPSEVGSAIRVLMKTKTAMFIWGAPGISKSQLAQQEATREGIAFIDLRLSQMDPTDLRGIPYPTEIGGERGVRWSTPYVMPKNLNLSFLVAVEAEETSIHFANPIGSNGIHYCTKPKVSVRALGNHTAENLGETLDTVTVVIKDADGNPVAGKVRVTVTGTTRAFLALEEFNSAPPSVQAAAYQLVLDRRLGEYIVPDGVFIVGMGNRDTDKGVTYKMPTPILNRFDHIEMRPDFDDWQRWALTTLVHPDVVGYLTAFKNKLFEFEPGTASRGFATPRSWVFVSEILNSKPDASETVMTGLINGCVGDGTGMEFMAFRKIARDLPQAEDILSGRLTTLNKKNIEVSLAFALTTTLCYELKERSDKLKKTHGTKFRETKEFDQWQKEADNVFSFMMNDFQTEICVMGFKTAIQLHQLPVDTKKSKSITEFANRFRDLIMN